MTSTETDFVVTMLYGELKLEPVRYTFHDNGDGTGEIRSEFGSISGDNRHLKTWLALCDGQSSILTNAVDLMWASEAPKGWWERMFG